MAPSPLADGPAAGGRRPGRDPPRAGTRRRSARCRCVEVRTGEPLVVVLAETGGSDPAVAELETEITLEAGEGGWAVAVGAGQRTTACRCADVARRDAVPPIG